MITHVRHASEEAYWNELTKNRGQQIHFRRWSVPAEAVVSDRRHHDGILLRRFDDRRALGSLRPPHVRHARRPDVETVDVGCGHVKWYRRWRRPSPSDHPRHIPVS